jgi:hypothetical protein
MQRQNGTRHSEISNQEISDDDYVWKGGGGAWTVQQIFQKKVIMERETL